MDLYSLTDDGVGEELGRRLKELRLSKNLTQQELARSVAVARSTIERLESGTGKISVLVAVLRELGQLENLELLLPDRPPSPLVLAARQGRKKERASRKRQAQLAPETDW